MIDDQDLLTDREIIAVLVDHLDVMGDRDRAFVEDLHANWWDLTDRQRAWVHDIVLRYRINLL